MITLHQQNAKGAKRITEGSPKKKKKQKKNTREPQHKKKQETENNQNPHQKKRQTKPLKKTQKNTQPSPTPEVQDKESLYVCRGTLAFFVTFLNWKPRDRRG